MQLNNKNLVKTALFAVLVGALGYSFVAKSETKLLPFQGKLTDANGQVIPDKAIVVQFKMYDAPVGGNAKWNGEVQMLTVNGGLVNTTLGTKASLKNVDFSTPTYLEITIDANGDNEIGPEDPPLLPRQSIIPAVYAVEAGNSKTMGGHDWSAVFSNGDPNTGKIDGGKLADKSVSTAQIDNNAVTANQIKAGAVTEAKIKAGAVTTDKIANKAIKSDKIDDNAVTSIQLADGSITTAKLDKDAVITEKIAENSITTELLADRDMVKAHETTAPIGSFAISRYMQEVVSEPYEFKAVYPNSEQVPGMSLKLQTSGRPVMVTLQRGYIQAQGSVYFTLERDGTEVAWGGLGGGDVTITTSGVVTFIDTPPVGEHQYSLHAKKLNGSSRLWGNPHLIAFEL